MLMKKIAIFLIIAIAGFPSVIAAELTQQETKPVEPVKDSRLFVGAKINPHYKIDCKESSKTYDPYYCGLRNSPEVIKFSAPRPGLTFTF